MNYTNLAEYTDFKNLQKEEAMARLAYMYNGVNDTVCDFLETGKIYEGLYSDAKPVEGELLDAVRKFESTTDVMVFAVIPGKNDNTKHFLFVGPSIDGDKENCSWIEERMSLEQGPTLTGVYDIKKDSIEYGFIFDDFIPPKHHVMPSVEDLKKAHDIGVEHPGLYNEFDLSETVAPLVKSMDMSAETF